MVLFIK